MGTPSTNAKLKYNRSSYKRYEFNVKVDSKLNALIERYKSNPNNSFSELIKSSLCNYFGIDWTEAESIFVEYHLTKDGSQIMNKELEKYLDKIE